MKVTDLRAKVLAQWKGKDIKIFVVSGIALSGKLQDFDGASITLESGGRTTLVFNEQITTVILHDGR